MLDLVVTRLSLINGTSILLLNILNDDCLRLFHPEPPPRGEAMHTRCSILYKIIVTCSQEEATIHVKKHPDKQTARRCTNGRTRKSQECLDTKILCLGQKVSKACQTNWVHGPRKKMAVPPNVQTSRRAYEDCDCNINMPTLRSRSGVSRIYNNCAVTNGSSENERF